MITYSSAFCFVGAAALRKVQTSQGGRGVEWPWCWDFGCLRAGCRDTEQFFCQSEGARGWTKFHGMSYLPTPHSCRNLGVSSFQQGFHEELGIVWILRHIEPPRRIELTSIQTTPKYPKTQTSGDLSSIEAKEWIVLADEGNQIESPKSIVSCVFPT